MRISPQEAAHRLNLGEVVAIPTETVYGLAASLKHPTAIARIFALKGRPSDNPLIIHIASRNHLQGLVARLPAGAEQLMEHFWPGPLTLVLPIVVEAVPEQVRAGLPTAAFRTPANPLTLAILQETGPLVAPSANLSGSPSATSPEHVEEDFGPELPLVDGGACQAGVESTILLPKGDRWVLGRLGALSAEALATVLGYMPEQPDKSPRAKPVCPGSAYRHYAPKAKLMLGHAGYDGAAEVVIGFSDRTYPAARQVLLLGPTSQPERVLHRLYAALRSLDRHDVREAWVDMDVPTGGLWDTYRERLTRAAQG